MTRHLPIILAAALVFAAIAGGLWLIGNGASDAQMWVEICLLISAVVSIAIVAGSTAGSARP